MPEPTTKQNPADYGRVRQPYQGDEPAAPAAPAAPAKPAKEG